MVYGRRFRGVLVVAVIFLCQAGATAPGPVVSEPAKDDYAGFSRLPDVQKAGIIRQLFEDEQWGQPDQKPICADILHDQAAYSSSGAAWTVGAIDLAESQKWDDLAPLIQNIYEWPRNVCVYERAFRYLRARSGPAIAPEIAAAGHILEQSGWYGSQVTDGQITEAAQQLASQPDKTAVLVYSMKVAGWDAGREGNYRGRAAAGNVLKTLDPEPVANRLRQLCHESDQRERFEVRWAAQYVSVELPDSPGEMAIISEGIRQKPGTTINLYADGGKVAVQTDGRLAPTDSPEVDIDMVGGATCVAVARDGVMTVRVPGKNVEYAGMRVRIGPEGQVDFGEGAPFPLAQGAMQLQSTLATSTRPAARGRTDVTIKEPYRGYYEADLDGQVVDDATGQPVERYEIQEGWSRSVAGSKINWMATHYAPVREKGKFQESESFLAGQSAWVRILAQGYLPELVAPEPLQAPAVRSNLVVRLKRGIVRHGQVLDYTGKPMAGASVTLVTHEHMGIQNGIPALPGSLSYQGTRVDTGSDGRFALPGCSGAGDRIIVCAPSLLAWPVPPSDGDGDLIIRLPQPATLTIHYEIDGADDEGAFEAQLRTWGVPAWEGVDCVVQDVKCRQGGEVVVANLPPGTYDIGRSVCPPIKDSRAYSCDGTSFTVKPGEKATVDFVRKTGQRVPGKVVGLDYPGVPGATILVMSAGTKCDPRQVFWAHGAIFDALSCGRDGAFKTARLLPGKYSVVGVVFRGIPKIPGHFFISLPAPPPAWIATTELVVPETGEASPIRLEATPFMMKPAIPSTMPIFPSHKPLAITTDPKLDPQQTGAISITSADAYCFKDKTILNIYLIRNHLAVDCWFDSVITNDGREWHGGTFLELGGFNNITRGGFCMKFGRLPSDVHTVDLELRPDFAAADQCGRVVWGKSMIFHNVPLHRRDFPWNMPIPKAHPATTKP